MPQGYAYILSNHTRMLYVGMTDDIRRRVFEHKIRFFEDGFTARYLIGQLVFYEQLVDLETAMAREKQLKGWSRKKKIVLLEKVNPNWLDLSDKWFRAEDLAYKYFRELDDASVCSPSLPKLRNGSSLTPRLDPSTTASTPPLRT